MKEQERTPEKNCGILNDGYMRIKSDLLDELKKQLLVSKDKSNDRYLYQLIVETKSDKLEKISPNIYKGVVQSWDIYSSYLGCRTIIKTA